jgi:MFS family permease
VTEPRPGYLLAGLTCMLLAVSEGDRWGWGSTPSSGCSWPPRCCWSCGCATSSARRSPLVDIDLLRLRGVWTTNPTAFLIGPSAAIMLVAGPLAGSLAGRVGSKVPLLLGTAAAAASFAILAVAHDEVWQIVGAVFLLGFGIGMSFASMANLIVEAVPQHQAGEATGMNTIMRTVGGAFGAQIAAAIVTGHLEPGTRYAAESGFTAAFAMGAIALVVALGAAALIPGRRVRSVAETLSAA